MTSAEFRFGLTFCPSCNPNNLPSQDIPESIQCAWCYDEANKIHHRYVTRETLRRWRREHGLPEDDLPIADTIPVPSDYEEDK